MQWINIETILPPTGVRLLVCGVWVGDPQKLEEAQGLHQEGPTIAYFNSKEKEWIKDNDAYVDHVVTHYAYIDFPTL